MELHSPEPWSHMWPACLPHSHLRSPPLLTASKLQTTRIRTTTSTCQCLPCTATTTTQAERAQSEYDSRCLLLRHQPGATLTPSLSLARALSLSPCHCQLQSLSAVDLLAMANLLNYFGKCEWVSPVLSNPCGHPLSPCHRLPPTGLSIPGLDCIGFLDDRRWRKSM
jgi:hypothetical protein